MRVTRAFAGAAVITMAAAAAVVAVNQCRRNWRPIGLLVCMLSPVSFLYGSNAGVSASHPHNSRAGRQFASCLAGLNRWLRESLRIAHCIRGIPTPGLL